VKVWFTKFAQKASAATGHASAFIIAFLVVVAWGITGPIFHYSDTWQLVINTGTTIVTFLMVFLIQNTQNRDTAAMQIKLDELIFRKASAQDGLLDLEDMDEEELDKIRAAYRAEARRARANGEEMPSVREVVEKTNPRLKSVKEKQHPGAECAAGESPAGPPNPA
jgi:low affinity Fe/Cu permease